MTDAPAPPAFDSGYAVVRSSSPLTFVGPRTGGGASAIAATLTDLEHALVQAGASPADVVRLGVVYREDAFSSREAVLESIADRFGASERPAISVLPVRWLPDRDTAVQIDAIASSEPIVRLGDHLFPDVVRAGDIVVTSAQSAPSSGTSLVEQTETVMQRLRALVEVFGATLQDVCKYNIFYRGTGTADDWEVTARVRAGYFEEPGPAASGIPVPGLGIRDALTAMEVLCVVPGVEDRERVFSWPAGHWDWPIHLPYKHGNATPRIAFVGGQVALTPEAGVIHPGALEAQTAISMENIRRVLAGLGFGMDEIVRLDVFYVDDGTGRDFARQIPVQLEQLGTPRPVATHIGLPFLAYEQMMIEIEAIAMHPA